MPIESKRAAKFDQPAPAAPSNSPSQDVFVWFDETAPAPGTPLFDVVVTACAYDGVLGILRQARQGKPPFRLEQAFSMRVIIPQL
jgi:hypothetical protein